MRMKTPPPIIEQLVWDDWNLQHIQKHDVTAAEAEKAVGPDALYAVTSKNRLVVTGPTRTGRVLTVVIGETPDLPNHWYVFSARPASRKERTRFYEAEKGGGP